jgi:hypothetical protein
MIVPLHEATDGSEKILYASVRKSFLKKSKRINREICALLDKDYHKRSNIRSVFHALKQSIMPNLRFKLNYMKKREIA